jgi:hypothetical protein
MEGVKLTICDGRPDMNGELTETTAPLCLAQINVPRQAVSGIGTNSLTGRHLHACVRRRSGRRTGVSEGDMCKMQGLLFLAQSRDRSRDFYSRILPISVEW